MFKKKIVTGCSDFKEMIETGAYYVDKSLLVEEVICNGDKVILLPRPRRFGKTLNLSMLRYYFDIQQPDNKKLFENLQIWQCDEEIKAEQGKYPIIYLSLKNAKGNTWEKSLQTIILEIANLYKEHAYLLDSEVLRKEEKIKFEKIINETASEVDFEYSIKQLSEYLYNFYNQKVIILLDEYDAPIQSAYGKYYDEAINFMRSLMSGAFKDNVNLQKAVITGIMRVSKESIFSGLNNIGVYNILHDEFADKFGFTEYEVKELVDFKGYNQSLYSEIRDWYDGYVFGDTKNIYNPWSVLTLLKRKKIKFEPYWVNTSSNDLIKSEIRNKQNLNIREDILQLIEGRTIEREIEENFVFTELDTRKNLVWTLFVYSGYLTVEQKFSGKRYSLRIPNKEVKTIFQDTIKEWFEADLQSRRELEDAIFGLLNNDLQKFERNFKN